MQKILNIKCLVYRMNLKSMNQKKLKKIKSKEEAISIAEKLYNNRENAIKTFENKVFLLSDELEKKKVRYV